MALLIQDLFLIAADLMFASTLSCLLYAAGCLVFTGLVGYVVVLSCGGGMVKNAKRNICQMKEAALITVSNSCVGRTTGRILGLVGLRGTALCPSEQASILKEECSSTLNVKQLPAGEKKYQKAMKTLTGGQLSPTGISGGMKKSGMIWEEDRETSQADESKVTVNQKKVSEIPAFLLSLLFAPSNWCLKKRHFQWLATLLTTLKKSRD